MPKKFESDQEAVFSMAFLTKVTNITILNFLLCQHDQHGPRILIIMTSTQINQKKMRRLEKEYTTMKSKEKEVMMMVVMMATMMTTMMTFKMIVVMMAMMVTSHDSYERNASLQNAPELILARCKDVLWRWAQCNGVPLYSAQCTVNGYIIVHSAKYFVHSVRLMDVQLY